MIFASPEFPALFISAPLAELHPLTPPTVPFASAGREVDGRQPPIICCVVWWMSRVFFSARKTRPLTGCLQGSRSKQLQVAAALFQGGSCARLEALESAFQDGPAMRDRAEQIAEELPGRRMATAPVHVPQCCTLVIAGILSSGVHTESRPCDTRGRKRSILTACQP